MSANKFEKPKFKRGFYNQKYQKGAPKRNSIDINQKGFLCSCNNREKDCIREAYNILNKYADILYPIQRNEEGNNSNSSDNIEDELKREINDLKSNKFEKRFQVVESGAKNFLFIKTTLENPVELAHKILSDINESKTQQSKFLLRLVPIEIVCKAYITDIEKSFETLAEKHFKDGPKTFSIVFNHRNNNNVDRNEVIKKMADIVFKIRDDHKVDLKNSDYSIVVEIIRGYALIGVVPDFVKLKKYNLMALCDLEDSQSEKMTEDGDTVDRTDVSVVDTVDRTDVGVVDTVDSTVDTIDSTE